MFFVASAVTFDAKRKERGVSFLVWFWGSNSYGVQVVRDFWWIYYQSRAWAAMRGSK